MLKANPNEKQSLQSQSVCFLNLKHPLLGKGIVSSGKQQIVVFGRVSVGDDQEKIFAKRSFRENMILSANYSKESKEMINVLSDLSRNLDDEDEETRRRRRDLKNMANHLDKFLVKYHLFVHGFKK
jgi:galactokinase/mevalonate kinase-like predicted kinase